MRKMVQSVESRLQSDIRSDLSALATQLDMLKQRATETGANVTKQAQTIESLIDASETKSKTLKASLDESVALLGEQINMERTRVDALTGTRQAINALNEEVRAVKQVLTDLEAQLKQADTERMASELNLKDIQVVVEVLTNNSHNSRAEHMSLGNASLGLEVLSEEMDRLSQQVSQQQQIIEAVDASRKQLTQRIIDLDGRVNLALSSKQ